MEIITKHYNRTVNGHSKIIELTFKDHDCQFTVDVTDYKGYVDESLIENLKQVIEELETQNKLLKELYNQL